VTCRRFRDSPPIAIAKWSSQLGPITNGEVHTIPVVGAESVQHGKLELSIFESFLSVFGHRVWPSAENGPVCLTSWLRFDMFPSLVYSARASRNSSRPSCRFRLDLECNPMELIRTGNSWTVGLFGGRRRDEQAIAYYCKLLLALFLSSMAGREDNPVEICRNDDALNCAHQTSVAASQLQRSCTKEQETAQHC